MKTGKWDKIIVHAGAAHTDDVMSLAIALTLCENKGVKVFRALNVTEEELNDPHVLVLDIGGKHQPELSNFDHHQLPRDAAPECALSLFAEHMELNLNMYEWFQFVMLLDSKGPFVAANKYGLDPKDLFAMLNPLGLGLTSLFEEYGVGQVQDSHFLFILWQIGRGIVKHVETVNTQLEQIKDGAGSVELVGNVLGLICTLERVDPKTMQRYKEEQEGIRTHLIAFSICRDDRGDGWTLYRYNDHPDVDFSKLNGNPQVVFAHNGGFIAKTKKMPVSEALELVKLAVKQ